MHGCQEKSFLVSYAQVNKMGPYSITEWNKLDINLCNAQSNRFRYLETHYIENWKTNAKFNL